MSREKSSSDQDPLNILNGSEAKSYLPYRKLPLPYQALDLEGIILDVNPHWLIFFGYDHQEVIGAPFSDFLHPDELQHFKHTLSSLAAGNPVSGVQLHILGKNGTSQYVTLAGNLMEKQDSELARIHCLLSKIPDKDPQELTYTARDAWSRTFDMISDIVTIQDRSLRIIKANKAAYRFFQAGEGELTGKFCYEIFTGASEPCPNCPLLATIINGSEHSAIVRHDRLNTVFEVSSSIIPSDNGSEDFLLHVARDITRDLERDEILQKSEEKFSLAFEASPDAVNINRLEDGMYVDVNNGFTTLTGFTREDVLGKTSLEINIWHDTETRQRLVRNLRENGYYENLEAKFRRKDGSTTIGLMSARIIMLSETPHILSITRDIGTIKKAEHKIAEQKLIFESMFNAIDDGVVITDIDRVIILANKGMHKTFGYDPEEVIGKSTAILYADFEKFQESGEKTFNSESKKNDRLYVAEYKHKSGRVFSAETFGVKLYDQDKKWIGNLGIMRDISERQTAEVERDRLIAAIGQTSDAIVITDPEGNIQYVNPAFEEVTGYSFAEAIGKNPRILKSGKQDRSFYLDLWQTISQGRTFKGRMVNRRKDGKYFTEEATISPVCDHSGTIISYVAVKRDITEQILLEAQFQQAQKMEAVGRLTGGVAHDFNNILGVIIGYSEMALDELDPTEKLHGDLEKILDAAERSAGLVRQLLAFSRQQPIAPKVLNLNDAVEKMLKMLRSLIGENIDLTWFPGDSLQLIKMDPTQIDQILANLCVNAKDAIHGVGKITLETAMVTFDEEYCANHLGFCTGEFVQLSVSDNGNGIDKEAQKKIFEPFFSTKEMGRGTGLGLSTVYGIIKQNSGFINVYSEPTVGTTFKLYFPVCTQESLVFTEKPKVQARRSQGETILLVEDETTLLVLTQKMLEMQGYTVLAANTPTEALTQIIQYTGDVQLLLTDIVLPEMNGRELAHLIRKHHPQIKILFMSGYTANVIVHNGILDEDINFIQKPFSIGDLTSKIREILQMVDN